MGLHSDESLEDAALSGAVYQQRRTLRWDEARTRADRAELDRLMKQLRSEQRKTA